MKSKTCVVKGCKNPPEADYMFCTACLGRISDAVIREVDSPNDDDDDIYDS